MNYLDRSVTTLKGVGDTRAKQLARLGINTLRDLVYFFPRAYERRGDVRPLGSIYPELTCSVILTVGTAVKTTRIKNRMTISKFKAFDDTGAIEIVFFNSPFVKDIFTLGATFRFFGKFTASKKQIQMISPKYEPYIDGIALSDFVPVYPLTEGLSSKLLDKLIISVIDEAAACIKDPLPEAIRLENNLATLSYAIKNAHFPKDESALAAAMSRLAFDEMLLFGMGISLQARFKQHERGIKFKPCSLKPLTDIFPYELTADQKSAINDVYRDTVIGNGGVVSPMARIIVGDVGCGKTVCAVSAMYIAAKSGYQSALMVPTEILANQHYAEIKETFERLGISTRLLVGSTSLKEKREIYRELETGGIDVIVGTHALISEKVAFSSLGLVITDEQHRFGVNQRALLKDKGSHAHLLVMSATPIPRSLALTMYGDLDVSRIIEMPSGRMRVDTFVVDEGYRARLNDFIKKQVALGGQCYVVCPAIEQDDEYPTNEPASLSSPFSRSEPSDMKYAVTYTENLRAELPELRIACMHGRLKSQQKDEIMQSFAVGDIDVLVSTTVIEIGINVPNASLMIIENAERFGLAQLHQLRGRVGRGTKKSYCVLVSSGHSNEKSKSRLEIMRTVYNGYEIAERDLMLRGPGDFFSQNLDDNFRQSGGFEFKFAKLCDDNLLFESAFKTAKSIVEIDPELNMPEHSELKKSLNSVIIQNSSNIS